MQTRLVFLVGSLTNNVLNALPQVLNVFIALLHFQLGIMIGTVCLLLTTKDWVVSQILQVTVESRSVVTIRNVLFVRKDIILKADIAIVVQVISWELHIVMNVELIQLILLELDAIHVLAIEFQQKIIILVRNLCSIVRSWTIIEERNFVLNVSKGLLSDTRNS